MRTVRSSWVAAVAGALLLAGCGDGAVEANRTTTAACESLPGARTAARSNAGPQDLTLLTDVQVDARDCVDRLAFTFRDDAAAPPGYRISYQPAETALVEDGSGRRLDVSGSAFLVVRFEAAATAEASADGTLTFTYTGPRRLEPSGTRFVREVRKSGDFEAVVTWVIGLSEQRPFRATASTSPAQLVVEVG